MLKKRFVTSLTAIILCLWLTSAHADRALKASRQESYSEQRVALVIGNGDYKNSPLKNPVNDATDVAKKLDSLGFIVKRLINANQMEMRKAIRQFGSDLKKGGVGLFYYAGHGMQVRGNNYLIPVGADITAEDEVEDLAVDAGMVLRKMQSAENRLNIVVLDACRNNPFARSFRSAERGLAQMDAPSGSMISYATAPGMTAADGHGRNGIFTKHFLKTLDQNGMMELSQFMKQVGKGVLAETGKGQIPWVSSSITGDFYFVQNPSDKQKTDNSTVLIPSRKSTVDEEEELWLAIKSSNNVADFKDYNEIYPQGRFKKIANIKIRQLTAEVKSPAVERRDHVTELKTTVSDSQMLWDAFNGNENSWTLWPGGQNYTTEIKDGSFFMETKNKFNSAEFIGKSIVWPDNFEIQVTATWKKGVDDRAYGITLGSDAQNRYNFGVSGNGWSFVSGYKDNAVIDPAPMPWKSGTALIGDGYSQNTLTIKVKGSTYDFYVNNLFVGTVEIPIPHDRLRLGFFVENMQLISFDDLKVTSKSGSGSLLYSDGFHSNQNSWTLWPNGDSYITAIDRGVYMMETKNTLNSSEFPAKFVRLPANFDIEVTTTWKKGVDNYAYGLTMGTDAQNRYNFGLSGNGWSYVSGYANNQVIDPSPMPWKSGTSLISNGTVQNVIHIQVRGTRFDYYVNSMLVGSVTITLPRDRLRFGFFVENMQQVHFDNLKVTAN